MTMGTLGSIALNARRGLRATPLGGAVHNLAPLTSISTLVPQTSSITVGYNYQCRRVVADYRQGISDISDAVRQQLHKNPAFESQYYRARAIDKAWEMERIDVEWGGRGSENWTRAERDEILRYGRIRQEKVEGKIIKQYPGHHQKNVHHHPEEQGNPDNIRFFRSNDEHRTKGHDGDFHNESDKPMLDRARMVERTNTRHRVIKNELKGAGITAIISFATSTSITFILECARNGWSPQARRMALATAIHTGVETTAVSLLCYGVSRQLVEPSTKLIIKVLEKAGLTVTEGARELIGYGMVAVIAITITGILTYRKLRKAGFSPHESAYKVMQQSFLGLFFSALMFFVRKKLGTGWAIAVAVVLSLGYAGWQYYLTSKDRELMQKLQDFVLEGMYKSYSSRIALVN